MEHVSAEMTHFFEACEILLHDMYPRDFSDKECKLIEHYCLELYVRYGSRRSEAAIINSHTVGKSQPLIADK
jgi:hypothetical protein